MLKFIKNPTTKIATIHGVLTVKEDGTVEGLTAEQEKGFANISGFEFTEEEKKASTRKQTTSTSKDEEPKEEEKKASTRKQTTSTRKQTTRKTTAKKDEEK